jgi:hypothetical protein
LTDHIEWQVEEACSTSGKLVFSTSYSNHSCTTHSCATTSSATSTTASYAIRRPYAHLAKWTDCLPKYTICSFFLRVESNSPSRYTRVVPSHMAQHLSWPQPGAPPPNYQATHSKTRTSSSSRPSARSTTLLVGPLTSPATASYTLLLPDNCRAMSHVRAAGTSRALSI